MKVRGQETNHIEGIMLPKLNSPCIRPSKSHNKTNLEQIEMFRFFACNMSKLKILMVPCLDGRASN